MKRNRAEGGRVAFRARALFHAMQAAANNVFKSLQEDSRTAVHLIMSTEQPSATWFPWLMQLRVFNNSILVAGLGAAPRV
jgi:hypothetical protein